VASASNLWDWSVTVGQVLGHLTLQTAVHCDANLVLDTFRNVKPVQIVVHIFSFAKTDTFSLPQSLVCCVSLSSLPSGTPPPVSEMTYTVLSGTLNSTIPYLSSLRPKYTSLVLCIYRKTKYCYFLLSFLYLPVSCAGSAMLAWMKDKVHHSPLRGA